MNPEEEARKFQEQIAQNKLRNEAMLKGLGIADYLQSLEAAKAAADKARYARSPLARKSLVA